MLGSLFPFYIYLEYLAFQYIARCQNWHAHMMQEVLKLNLVRILFFTLFQRHVADVQTDWIYTLHDVQILLVYCTDIWHTIKTSESLFFVNILHYTLLGINQEYLLTNEKNIKFSGKQLITKNTHKRTVFSPSYTECKGWKSQTNLRVSSVLYFLLDTNPVLKSPSSIVSSLVVFPVRGVVIDIADGHLCLEAVYHLDYTYQQTGVREINHWSPRIWPW